MRVCKIKFSDMADEIDGTDHPDLTDDELVKYWTEGWSTGDTIRYGKRVHGDTIVPEYVRVYVRLEKS